MKTTKAKNKMIQVDPAYNAVNITPVSGHGYLSKKAQINSITATKVDKVTPTLDKSIDPDDVYVSH